MPKIAAVEQKLLASHPPTSLLGRCNLSHMMDSPPQAPTSSAVPSLLLPFTSSSSSVCVCVCVCVIQPYPTSQSNSRCSCPSIHSSMSNLLCRSLRLYLTVSLPSLRCAGSSVLSAAWNITLDWVLGSDAMAATASGEPWKHTELSHAHTHSHTHTDRPTGYDTYVLHTGSPALSLSLPFLWATVPTRISYYLVECSCSLSLSITLALVLCLSSSSLSLSLSL